jgi:hypothetical protein
MDQADSDERQDRVAGAGAAGQSPRLQMLVAQPLETERMG